MMKPESKRPITIEDLLRLKRAERPPAEFWDEFDRSLRAKQLAALVEKRPWWQAMPRVLAGFKLYHLPIAATAVAVVAFISLRDNSGVNASHKVAPAAQDVAVASSASSGAVSREARMDTMAVAVQPAETLHVTATVDGSAPSASGITLASAATAPGEISRMIPMIGASSAGVAGDEQSPSARAIAANLASVRGSEPVLGRNLLNNVAIAEAQSSSRPAIEPLQQITPPGDRRRSNLTTAMVSMTSFETPARNGDRVANRLSEDELYDRIHRFGARGNSVSMKF
jgi:hypothetical protein